MDHNLRLAILSALCRQGVYQYVDKSKYFDDVADENYEPYQPIIEHWLKQPIDPYLDKITELTWGSDDDMVFNIWTYWDGEDDYFDIKSLAGIEQLTNLKTLKIEWLLVDTAENRQIVKQLEQRGVTIRINGKPGWEPKKPLPPPPQVHPTPVIEPYYPAVKKDITIAATPSAELQTKLDAKVLSVFGLKDSTSTQTEEPTSVGGFKQVKETQATQDKASYHSIVTKVYWSEQEIANVSFYARYLLGTHCLTITGSAQNTDQLTTLTVEAANIDPEKITQITLRD